jgi:hypothetical protein
MERKESQGKSRGEARGEARGFLLSRFFLCDFKICTGKCLEAKIEE